jgi:hypothetical protein
VSVRRLRAKQRGPRCSYCPSLAKHRGMHFTKFACEDHRSQLVADDEAAAARDSLQSDADWALGI